MTKTSRILLAFASASLLLLLVLPLWSIRLEAPQYPEGLGLEIRVNTVQGAGPHDLKNINGLNHYIGMRPIEPDAIPELRYMPWIVIGLAGLGLLAAAAGRRWIAITWFGLYGASAIIGLIDFYRWEYDYGHNLDEEHAILKIPGMSYQPPLIGAKKLLNFVAHSWPASGGWIAIGAGVLVAVVLVREVRGTRRERGEAPVAARTMARAREVTV